MEKTLLESLDIFAHFTETERMLIAEALELVIEPAGALVIEEGTLPDAFYVIIEGQARLHRQNLTFSKIGVGAAFGELGIAYNRPRAVTVIAETDMKLAKLTRAKYEELMAKAPEIAPTFLRAVVTHLDRLVHDMTDNIAMLLNDSARPRRLEVEARFPDGRVVTAQPATPLCQLLPTEVNGQRVIAALQDRRLRSLNSPLHCSADIEPVLMNSSEGRTIHRRSMALLLLAASRRLGGPRLRIGPSMGFANVIDVEGCEIEELPQLAEKLSVIMAQMIKEQIPIRSQRFSIEEARKIFMEQDWKSAAKLLRVWRSSTVQMVSLEGLYALQIQPPLPDTGFLGKFELFANGAHLILAIGDEPRHGLLQVKNPYGLVRAHQRWLNQVQIGCVGDFNQACISGKVREIIQVAEGFHEKRLGEIADQILNAPNKVRVICVAGPSSSGKTTFIKRLSVQLKVNGMQPVGVSMDDFYVDRERTPRDESGEYDFEAFDALDIELMETQLHALMRGETVTMARYDFKTGKSLPNGGKTLHLGPNDVLLLEGIHALNPKVLPGESSVFRIFINAMSSLPLDDLNQVSVSDLRLIRRIVRDRYERNISPAESIMRWPSVRAGERKHIFPNQHRADAQFNSSLIYEPAVLKIYAEQYLLEVSEDHPAHTTAHRLRRMLDRFISIYPDHVGPTSLLREFIGGLSF